jgi:hypothetical protein
MTAVAVGVSWNTWHPESDKNREAQKVIFVLSLFGIFFLNNPVLYYLLSLIQIHEYW